MRWGAAIFDLDGVLADSAVLHYAAWKRLADTLAIPFDEEMNEALKGVDRMGSLRLILARGGRTLPASEIQALADAKNAHYQTLVATVTPADVLPGVTALLAEARGAGLALAVASASRNAAALLDRLEIADRFDYVADAGAVARPKPAPDIFLACSEALGVEPDRCIAVEDAAAGVEAIRAAGMFAVGVGDSRALARAHVVFATTAAITLPAILARSGVA